MIDIFAGPGGLGEGFGRLRDARGRRAFRSALSIEKETAAHRTLTLRAFYRQFDPDEVPAAYFNRVRGDLSTGQLFDRHRKQADAAIAEAWQAELGTPAFPVQLIRERVAAALHRAKDWVLLGGPPCQAYSLAGRSRNRGIKGYRFEEDHKSTLYLEYLQLIADFWPAVFVMENVKGLLSAQHSGESMFDRIREDLSDPARAIRREGRTQFTPGRAHQYDLYPIAPADPGLVPTDAPRDFVVHAERYGVPQARHRVILIGVRRGFAGRPKPLTPYGRPVTVEQAIADLPRLRSGLSKGDSPERWSRTIARLGGRTWKKHLGASGLNGDRVARHAAAIAARANFPYRLLPVTRSALRAPKGSMVVDRFRVHRGGVPSWRT